MTTYHILTERDPHVKLWVGKVCTRIGVAHRTPWCDTEDQARDRAREWLEYRLAQDASWNTQKENTMTHTQDASAKRPNTYTLKLDPGTSRVYLWDGYKQLFSFASRIHPCNPASVADWPTVGYTADMGQWRKGEYTTVPGWHHFLADPYRGPAIAIRQ